MASTSLPRHKDIVLLRTKLSVPPLNPRTIPSVRLIERLRRGALGRLTLVSAPAGFGKTTLVCQWIREDHLPVAWYSLDQTDNEPSVFYRYLLTSLQDLDPSLKDAFDPLLQGHSVVGQETVAHVINHISQLAGRFHLVLDDFHEINAPSLHSDIAYLLRHCPSQLHVTLVSRVAPPFPLSRLRAAGEITELGMEDLQLSLEATAEFFRTAMRLNLPMTQIQELHSLTEGWLVGLQVIGYSIQRGHSPKKFMAGQVLQHKDMLDYLFEEVFSSQPPEVQEFLLKTALLKQLDSDLCDHMTAGGPGCAKLEELQQKNLFIIPMDSKLQWYRYHPLFAQMLQRRLQASGLHSLPELHKRASAWYAEHGYLAEAFQHALASEDLDFVADLVEGKFMTLIDNYEWAAARRWLETLPEEAFEQRFLLRLYHALVIFLQEELSGITNIISELERSLQEMKPRYSMDDEKHAEDLLLALKLNCQYYREPAEVVAAAEQALETISVRNVMARWLVQSVLSTAYIERGDLMPAMDVVRSGMKAYGGADRRGSNYVKVHLLNRQARLEFLLGNLKVAQGLLDDALEYAQSEDPPLRSAMAMFNITSSQISYSKNQLEKALEHAERCVEYAKPVSDVGYLLLGLRLQAFINESFGHRGMARSIMDEALGIARQTRSAVRMASTELDAVQLAVMQSDLEAVAAWVARRHLSLNEPFSRNYEKECILTASYEMASRQYRAALELLTGVRPRVERRQRATSLVTIDTLISAALYSLGRRDEALSSLESCIEFAGPEGYVRPFVENAVYLVDVLDSLGRSPKGVVRIHALELLKACRLQLNVGLAARPSLGGEEEALSPRELEVLRLIFAGLSNKEIAARSFISLNTVKTHIKNIYTKLGVATREQAIVRARQLSYV
jgi:LuxR family transcriptional regulator, maltose regulon positive regulatory protein